MTALEKEASVAPGISWEDETEWLVTTTETDIPKFEAYQIGNGRIGVRVGALLLDWDGDRKPLLCEDGPDFWGRLNRRLLMSLGKHLYDGGDQLILPAWNQVRMEIGGVEYGEGNGQHRLRHTLDMRTGEATCEDVWEYLPGRTVTVRIRQIVPRSHPCAAWFEISLSGLSEPARLRFGLNAAQVGGSFSEIVFAREENGIAGSYTTRVQKRLVAQHLSWESTGCVEIDYLCAADSAWLSLSTSGADASLVVVQSVHCSVDGPEPARRAEADLTSLDAAGRDQAVESNERRWRELWAGALCFRHPNRLWERLVLVNQFHLLVSLEERGGYPLGPLGLSRPGWHGAQMWDADFWLFRAMLPLWPKLARNLLGFRLATIEAARATARLEGFRGTFFTGACSDEGADLTNPVYRREIHINAWIGLAVWEASGKGSNRSYLAEVAWPILEGLAEFWISRGTRDPDGSWHVRKVLPPDESVAEGHRTSDGTCDDNVLTNFGARNVLRYAGEAAEILGKTAPPEWEEMAERLVILPPGPDGVIPEYAGYNGHVIKQADLILAFYPWQLSTDPGTVLRNVEYYHEKTDRGGPLMTTQIEALLRMLYGDRERGLSHLFNEYLRYVRGPHLIPYETPENANSMMLTGIGGLLQALIYGWFGASLEEPNTIPRIGDGWAAD